MTELAILRLEYERKEISNEIQRSEERIERLKEKHLELTSEIKRLKEGFYDFVPKSYN